MQRPCRIACGTRMHATRPPAQAATSAEEGQATSAAARPGPTCRVGLVQTVVLSIGRWAASSQGLRAGPRRWPGRVPMAMWASFARHGRPGLAGNGARLIWESGVSRLRKLGRKWLLKVYGSRRHPASPDFGARQRGRADQAPAGHWRDTGPPAKPLARQIATRAPAPAGSSRKAHARGDRAGLAAPGLRRGRGGQQGTGPGRGWAGGSSEACGDWAWLPVAVPACAGGRGHRVRKAEFLKECACVYGHRRRTKSTRVVDMIVCSIGGGEQQ